MEIDAISTTYARWAPVYDLLFGAATGSGRRRATGYISRRGGSVLEVGVGTGLALPLYGAGVEVTGIDFSQDMLDRARDRVRARGLKQVKALYRMDARHLAFADASFDMVAAMHVMSVVPEPRRVLAEMARVTRPGGEIVITTHFASGRGLKGRVERLAARHADRLGWHADFCRDELSGVPGLSVVAERRLPPVGLMTLLVLRRDP